MDRELINQRGKVSELIAIQSFIEDGREIAIPFGNQKSWDMLVEIEGSWKKIQIKTASSKRDRFSLFLSRGGQKSKRTYSTNEVDFVVAVSHSPRVLWLIPALVACNRLSMPLRGEFLWKGTIPSIAQQKRKTIIQRAAPAVMPPKPESISQSSWDMLILHLEGHSLSSIGRRYSISAPSVLGRLKIAIEKLYCRQVA